MAISSTKAAATCEAVNSPRMRRRAGVSVVCAPASFSATATSRRPVRAGALPNTIPVSSDRPSVKASTQPSIPTSVVRVVKSAAKATSRSRLSQATSSPKAPAARASRLASVTNCRSRRARPAPRADRRASSRSRRLIRASVRFATFAHAINSTSTVVASRISSVGRASRVSSSASGRVTAV